MRGIWIRTQDRRRTFRLGLFSLVQWGENRYRIIGKNGYMRVELGEYIGKEKATSVLNEIEDFTNSQSKGVYQMPNMNERK